MADFRPMCPKCSAVMERGHIPDMTYGSVLQSRWSRGDPEKRFLGGIKWKRGAQIPMTAYRCAQCGYVELYARPVVDDR